MIAELDLVIRTCVGVVSTPPHGALVHPSRPSLACSRCAGGESAGDVSARALQGEQVLRHSVVDACRRRQLVGHMLGAGVGDDA